MKPFTQRYLNHSKYGIGSGKAEEIREFVRELKSDKIIVDEHLTSKQIHNLEKLADVHVYYRKKCRYDIVESKLISGTQDPKCKIGVNQHKSI